MKNRQAEADRRQTFSRPTVEREGARRRRPAAGSPTSGSRRPATARCPRGQRRCCGPPPLWSHPKGSRPTLLLWPRLSQRAATSTPRCQRATAGIPSRTEDRTPTCDKGPPSPCKRPARDGWSQHSPWWFRRLVSCGVDRELQESASRSLLQRYAFAETRNAAAVFSRRPTLPSSTT
jgi:hypothetical protein